MAPFFSSHPALSFFCCLASDPLKLERSGRKKERSWGAESSPLTGTAEGSTPSDVKENLCLMCTFMASLEMPKAGALPPSVPLTCVNASHSCWPLTLPPASKLPAIPPGPFSCSPSAHVGSPPGQDLRWRTLALSHTWSKGITLYL